MLIGSSSATGLGPQAKALSIEISNYIITANSVACHPYFSDAARTLLQLLFLVPTKVTLMGNNASNVSNVSEEQSSLGQCGSLEHHCFLQKQ